MLRFLFVIMSLFMTPSVSFSKTFELGDTMIRLPKKPRKEARVRIGVRIVPYQKVIAKDAMGVNQIRFTKAKPIARNIRTQISKANHFYINQWHLETVPVSWDKSLKALEYSVKLYRRYGNSKDLEEYIGSIPLKGDLVGNNYVYSFTGKNAIKFKNKHNQNIAEIFLGPPIGARKVIDVARSNP